MLTTTAIQGLGREIQTIRGDLIVVKDHYGNPVVVVQELQPGILTVVTADDDDFNRVLRALGLDKVVICDRLESQYEPPEGARLLAGPNTSIQLPTL